MTQSRPETATYGERDAMREQIVAMRPLVEALAGMAPTYYPEDALAVCLCCPAEVTPHFDPAARPAGMDVWEDTRRRLEHDPDCPIGVARTLQAQWEASAASATPATPEGEMYP